MENPQERRAKIALICPVSWMTSKARIDLWREIEPCHGCLSCKQNWHGSALCDGLSIAFCWVGFTVLVMDYSSQDESASWGRGQVATRQARVCLQTPGNTFQLIHGGRFYLWANFLALLVLSNGRFMQNWDIYALQRAERVTEGGKSLAKGYCGTIKVDTRLKNLGHQLFERLVFPRFLGGVKEALFVAGPQGVWDEREINNVWGLKGFDWSRGSEESEDTLEVEEGEQKHTGRVERNGEHYWVDRPPPGLRMFLCAFRNGPKLGRVLTTGQFLTHDGPVPYPSGWAPSADCHNNPGKHLINWFNACLTINV